VLPVPDGPPLPPGELLVDRRRVLVGTATAPVELGDVQAPGKRPMPAPDWARGARPAPGARLGPVSTDGGPRPGGGA
jgi:methionyl-tRNA formyltransferase